MSEKQATIFAGFVAGTMVLTFGVGVPLGVTREAKITRSAIAEINAKVVTDMDLQSFDTTLISVESLQDKYYIKLTGTATDKAENVFNFGEAQYKISQSNFEVLKEIAQRKKKENILVHIS